MIMCVDLNLSHGLKVMSSEEMRGALHSRGEERHVIYFPLWCDHKSDQG
jgi:hypothetical protein